MFHLTRRQRTHFCSRRRQSLRATFGKARRTTSGKETRATYSKATRATFGKARRTTSGKATRATSSKATRATFGKARNRQRVVRRTFSLRSDKTKSLDERVTQLEEFMHLQESANKLSSQCFREQKNFNLEITNIMKSTTTILEMLKDRVLQKL